MSDQDTFPGQTNQAAEPSPQEVEKQEEAKLKAKYAIPGLQGRLAGGHSAFLQKRLSKGQKYFDSGDYQMAKQIMGGNKASAAKVPGPMPFLATGDAIPTPESVPVRKTSIVQPSKLSSAPHTTTTS